MSPEGLTARFCPTAKQRASALIVILKDICLPVTSLDEANVFRQAAALVSVSSRFAFKFSICPLEIASVRRVLVGLDDLPSVR